MMARISKLPDGDIQTLTSGQVITDVTSIVKELIENCLDADASAITIWLDGHGLERILVKDNGRGIPKADRENLAKKHYTSKLSSFAELENVRTYGFRGEALSSLAELCHSFKVTTRTRDERVSTTLELNARSNLRALKTSSELPGTTVTVGRPWYNIPVRREKFRKEANRACAKIRNLIDAYACINPHVRFHCTIKSWKKGEQPITISRLPQEHFTSSLASVFSQATVNACTAHHFKNDSLEVTMLLPSHAADSIVSSRGAFFYVDKRPINTGRGLPRKILTAVRSRIAEICPAAGKDPLIFLDIRCRPNTYDPNVEPHKDMIFWHDPDGVTGAISSMLAGIDADDPQCESSTETLACSQVEKPSLTNRVSQADHSTDITLEHTMDSDSRSLITVDLGITKNSDKITTNNETERKSSWIYSMFDEDHTDGNERLHDESHKLTSNGGGGSTSDLSMDLPETEDFVPDRPSLNNPWTLARQAVKVSKTIDHELEPRYSTGTTSNILSSSSRDVALRGCSSKWATSVKYKPGSPQRYLESERLSGDSVLGTKRLRMHHADASISNPRDVGCDRRDGIAERQNQVVSAISKKRARSKLPSAVETTDQLGIARYLQPLAPLIHDLSSDSAGTTNKRAKVYDGTSRMPKDGSNLEAKQVFGDDVRASSSATCLDRTDKADQTHNLSKSVSTNRLALEDQCRDINVLQSCAAPPYHRNLQNIHSIQTVAKLEGDMLLMRATGSDNETLAIFATTSRGIAARLDALITSRFKDIKMTGDSDGLIRLW